ncbi:MAG: efflux RND transporter periplasmic adaptor subunit [Gammaproteobacteria bacterium]|jgi:RND family efflux transporter MFP subunit|nr:efflux RND transporter periplasmic adaptor subunit [Gammaproteobacteria bacterium]
MRTRLASVLALSLLSACAREAAENPASGRPDEVAVIAEPVSMQTSVQRVEAVGTARARQAATIYAETGGEVTSIRFEPGDPVEAGSLLVTLEAEEEALAVALSEVKLREARQLLERYERIDVPGAVSDSQRDAARIAVEAAEIELELARAELDQRKIRAPFPGHIGITDVDVGARITPETPIAQLDDRSALFVDFEAPEQVFGEIVAGDTLEVIPFSAGQAPRPARVVTVGSRIDPERRLFTIRTLIDNRDDRLRPGMSFRVSFEIEGQSYAAVPEAALVWGGDGAYVWAVEDGQATRRPATIISRNEGRILVDAELSEGDLIVAEGVQKVRDGAPVSTGDTPAGPDTAAVQAVGGGRAQ